jgi:hypothetical protein
VGVLLKAVPVYILKPSLWGITKGSANFFPSRSKLWDLLKATFFPTMKQTTYNRIRTLDIKEITLKEFFLQPEDLMD